ncbi:MAG: tetratricopeptide repeat protein [Bacteroidaceae bacterium]|nr:tetratricopeptide repeat protein [Bacteroidaceae bacterium]
MNIRKLLLLLSFVPTLLMAQINTDRVMAIARNALYFEDYVLSIQYFNQIISAKPFLYEPYFYRGMAKFYLDDYVGAENDCSMAIDRNPFVVGAYQIRGLARIRQQKYTDAIQDYTAALRLDPENVVLWHNLSLCHMQQKEYGLAKDDLNRLLEVAPRYATAYLMRGEVLLNEKDTVQALMDYDKAIELEKFEPNGWSARAIVKLKQGKYSEAESDFDEAIRLSVRNAGNYINRALARFHQNNLRGAMSDYDLALDIDPGNFMGHYNRGLLRAQVGDDNRAIEDFDFVLNIDPDDMMATYNRGLLRSQTGDYRGAIMDFSKVLSVYPEFTAGYYQRAEARRKIGDSRGAQQDEFAIMRAQIDRLNQQANPSQGNKNKDDIENEDAASTTRKRSDKNVENYHKLVIADDTDTNRTYANDSRGRVQDRNITIKPEGMFVLTFYERTAELKRTMHYYRYVDELNHNRTFYRDLLITNNEAPLDASQVNLHFTLIDQHSADIVANESDPMRRFMRGLDFYLVQDFSNAINDFTQSILLDDTFFPAYFMRAIVRFKQFEYQTAEHQSQQPTSPSMGQLKVDKVEAMDYTLVRRDLDKVIDLVPDFVYGYYNRACLLTQMKEYRSAIVDYDKAIEMKPDFAEAYYNRGLTHIYLGNNRQGIADLSKAGELGIASAYNVIKRFTE